MSYQLKKEGPRLLKPGRLLLKTGNITFVQVGDGGLFGQGHASQDFTDDLVYFGGVGH